MRIAKNGIMEMKMNQKNTSLHYKIKHEQKKNRSAVMRRTHVTNDHAIKWYAEGSRKTEETAARVFGPNSHTLGTNGHEEKLRKEKESKTLNTYGTL